MSKAAVDKLIVQLCRAFDEPGPPPRVACFEDPADAEFYVDWTPVPWREVRDDDLIVYPYFSAVAKFYYIPGVVKFLLETGERYDAYETLLKDLSEPDDPERSEVFYLWQMLLDMPKPRFCAISTALPLLRELFGPSETTMTDQHFARRRSRYWNGEGCEES